MPVPSAHPPRAVAPARTARGLLALLALVMACGPAPAPDGDGDTGAAPAGPPPATPVAPADPDLLAADVRAAVQAARDAAAARPGDGAARRALARSYQANGLDREAAASHAQADRLAPDDAPGAYLHALVRWRLGERDAAREQLDRALSLAPDQAPLHARSGAWLLELGDLDGADQAFARAAALAPDDLAGPLGRARVAVARGDGSAALAQLGELPVTAADLGEVRFLRGSALRLLGRLDEARRELAAWDGEPAPRSDPWLASLADHAAGTMATLDRAVAWARAGQPQRALQPLRDLHAARPDDTAVLEKLVAVCLDLELFDEAEAALAASLARDPDHPRSHYLVARVREARGDLPGALEASLRSLALHDGWAPAHELAARLRWRGGDLDGAADHLRAALDAGGARLSNLQKLARAQRLLGRPDEAAATLERALVLQPGHPELTAALADVRRGQGRHAEAWELLLPVARSRGTEGDVGAVLAALARDDPAGAAVHGVR